MTDEREEEPVSQDPKETDLSGQFSDLLLEDQVIALQKELEESRQQMDQSRDMAQRAQAELVNYKRRAEDDRLALQQYSNSRLIIKMLPVVDELELAISHAEQNSSGESWWDGVKLIQRKVSGLFESEGVAQIESVGKIFDPLQHEALSTSETTEYPPGYIVGVIRNGYRLHDRVIQPAQVIVARAVSQQGNDDCAESTHN